MKIHGERVDLRGCFDLMWDDRFRKCWVEMIQSWRVVISWARVESMWCAVEASTANLTRGEI